MGSGGGGGGCREGGMGETLPHVGLSPTRMISAWKIGSN